MNKDNEHSVFGPSAVLDPATYSTRPGKTFCFATDGADLREQRVVIGRSGDGMSGTFSGFAHPAVAAAGSNLVARLLRRL